VRPLFDTKILDRYKNRAQPHIQDHNFLFQWVMEDIENRLSFIKRDFDHYLHLDVRAPFLPHKNGHIPDIIPSADQSTQQLDAPPLSQDLIIAPLCLHSLNDLPGMLFQIKQALKPDGLFIGAVFGQETLRELRESLQQTEIDLYSGMHPRVHPFIHMQQMGDLLQRAGFTLPVIDSEIITVQYSSLTKLCHDLRFMGEGCALSERSKHFSARRLFEQAQEYYQKHFSNSDGLLNASFEIIFISGWAPSNHQQKPLKPGSATARLSDILKTSEEKL